MYPGWGEAQRASPIFASSVPDGCHVEKKDENAAGAGRTPGPMQVNVQRHAAAEGDKNGL